MGGAGAGVGSAIVATVRGTIAEVDVRTEGGAWTGATAADTDAGVRLEVGAGCITEDLAVGVSACTGWVVEATETMGAVALACCATCGNCGTNVADTMLLDQVGGCIGVGSMRGAGGAI